MPEAQQHLDKDLQEETQITHNLLDMQEQEVEEQDLLVGMQLERLVVLVEQESLMTLMELH
jgi:hypothetical protein